MLSRKGQERTGSPKVKTCTSVVVECSGLSTDDLGHRLDEFVIKSGTHQDGLRERSGRVELSTGIEGNTRR